MAEVIDLFPTLSGKQIAIDTETCDPGLKVRGAGWCYQNAGHVVGISVACDNWAHYYPIGHDGAGNYEKERVIQWLKVQLGRPEQDKIFFNAGYDIPWLSTIGISVQGRIEDSSIAAPLLDENLPKSNYNLDGLALLYTGQGKDEALIDEWAKQNKIAKNQVKANIWRMPPEIVAPYATQDAVATLNLWRYQKPLLGNDAGVKNIYQLEMELMPVLTFMRQRGVRVDLDRAERLNYDYWRQEQELIAEVKRITGHVVSATDNKTVVPIFKEAGIEIPVTEKTGRDSVTNDWLDSLQHPCATDIRKLRKIHKIRTTFIEPLISEYAVNGRVHCSLKQMASDNGGTITGRFSCRLPNLQNQPNPDKDEEFLELGRDVRSLYLPEEGEKLVALDWKQQEPRLTLHYADLYKCKGAAEAVAHYKQFPDTSMHEYVMSLTGLAKRYAKDLGLGITYGMGEGKACRRLGLATRNKSFEKMNYVTGEVETITYEVAGEEGLALLHKFHTGVPFLKEIASKYKKIAEEHGEFCTMLGRKCRFPLREGGRWYTYKALNKLIQGSGADQMKLAILEMHKAGITPHLTVHDENVISTNKHSTIKLAREIMENCLPLRVPVLVDIEIGNNWGETRKYEHHK